MCWILLLHIGWCRRLRAFVRFVVTCIYIDLCLHIKVIWNYCDMLVCLFLCEDVLLELFYLFIFFFFATMCTRWVMSLFADGSSDFNAYIQLNMSMYVLLLLPKTDDELTLYVGLNLLMDCLYIVLNDDIIFILALFHWFWCTFNHNKHYDEVNFILFCF